MKISGMDPELVQIYNIRNLEAVKIWDFITNTNSKRLLVPGILVIYDGGNRMNLCAKDKYFDIYARKVMEVYNDEKENILEDSFTDPFKIRSRIDIDEKSAKILESGKLGSIDEYKKFYMGCDSYDGSLLFESVKVKSLMPILKYHLQYLFKYTDRVLSIDEDVTGYRENYMMTGRINGIDANFPFSFEELDKKEYRFYIGGLFALCNPIEVLVSFMADHISVILKTEDGELEMNATYKITDGVIKRVVDMKRRGLTIRYENEDLPRTEEGNWSNLVNLDRKVKLDWFRMPWGALYGYKSSIEELGEYEKIIAIESMFLDVTPDNFTRFDHYVKTYKRNRTVSMDAAEVVLDRFSKNVIGFEVSHDDKLYVLEASFFGDVEDYYSRDKCFYYGTISMDGIDGIKRNALVSLGKKQGLIAKSDLANTLNIKYLVKGEENGNI